MSETATIARADGAADVEAAIRALAARLPEPLSPLARLAYDYRWSWTPGGADLFAAVDRERWSRSGQNPIRLLLDASAAELDAAAANADLLSATRRIVDTLAVQSAQPAMPGRADATHPIAFLCAEFAIHESLPIYAGGLGVLAGDILKEASDLAVPMVGVGLLYRQGYFIQRMDRTGYQHEHWVPLDPERVPAVLVTNGHGIPVTVSVPVRGRELAVQVWRVNVGRIPLYLLDADRPENSRIDRWITARLYESDRAIRLAQYALLGIGSMRALAAMGMDPSVIHLNEGHAALAPIELARMQVARGVDRDVAIADGRARTVFTTHTPVGAGNEGYDLGEITEVMDAYPLEVGMSFDDFVAYGRTHPENVHEPFVMTPLGIRMSRSANGVSKRHGEVARSMWQSLFADTPADSVPIGHVTNGVHLPTWMHPRMRELLDAHLPSGWTERADDPAVWAGVDDISDEDLWQLRCELRGSFARYVRDTTVATRLARGEPREMVEAGDRGFDPGFLTIGFARRLATYKRLYILTMEPGRVAALIGSEQRPMQLVLAGKAHPDDEGGKRSAQGIFSFKGVSHGPERVSFLDNYDLDIAAHLVAGCDLWVNLPRPPLEASGTSGMKAVLNGGLNLSVLDGWWAEAFDGENGWGIAGDTVADPQVQDTRDAAAFYDLLEHEVAPLFYERDDSGIPRRWLQRVRRSMKTNGPRFSATRMVRDYATGVYLLNAPR